MLADSYGLVGLVVLECVWLIGSHQLLGGLRG